MIAFFYSISFILLSLHSKIKQLKMKKLQLSLKKEWFEMTKSGVKTEDYREINEYWMKRFFTKENYSLYLEAKFSGGNEFGNGNFDINYPQFKQFTYNIMTLGYPKSTDTDRILKLEHKGIEIRTGHHEWGAEPNKLYFVIKHGKKLDI